MKQFFIGLVFLIITNVEYLHTTFPQRSKPFLQRSKNLLHYLRVYGNAALFQAVFTNKKQLIEDILVNNELFDLINYQNEDGITPLMIAIAQNKNSIFDILLQDPALDKNLSDNENTCPLTFSILFNNSHAFNALLNAKASIHVANKRGKTPLPYAYFIKNKEFIERLLLTDTANDM